MNMLTRDEVEALIRITREQHMDYDKDYEDAYNRVEAIKGHKARMDELRTIESEREAQQPGGAKDALKLLFVLNGNDYGGCKLGEHVSCNVCPFNIGGPCALKSVTGLADRVDVVHPASYPRHCMEDIAKGVKETMAWKIDDEQFARIKKAVNILRREEGKPEIE